MRKLVSVLCIGWCAENYSVPPAPGRNSRPLQIKKLRLLQVFFLSCINFLSSFLQTHKMFLQTSVANPFWDNFPWNLRGKSHFEGKNTIAEVENVLCVAENSCSRQEWRIFLDHQGQYLLHTPTWPFVSQNGVNTPRVKSLPISTPGARVPGRLRDKIYIYMW